MAISNFRRNVLLTGLGFIIALGTGLLMLREFRNMIAQYSEFSRKMYDENVDNLIKAPLENMTDFIQKQYPVLADTERLKMDAGTEWFWKIALEWREIAEIFDFAYINYIEKKDDNYIFLLSSDIQQDHNAELLHDRVWINPPPAFFNEAWETKQLAFSPEPYETRWGTLVTVARPVISDGKVAGILSADYDISVIEKHRKQELYLEKEEKFMLRSMRVILLVSIIIIAVFMGYQIWLSHVSVLISAQKAEADKRIRVMLDTMSFACYFFDRDVNLIDCNQRALDLFGYKNKEEFMKMFLYLSPVFQPDGSKSIDKARGIIRNMFETDINNFTLRWEHIKNDGDKLPVEINLRKIEWNKDYSCVGYVRDMSTLVKTEDNLRRVSAMVETTPNFTLFLGADGNIEYMNPAVSKISGFSFEEFHKDGLALIFSPEDYYRLNKDYISAALKGKLVNFEMTVIAKSDVKLDFSFAVFSVQMSDGNSGIGLSGRDITELKRMQFDLAVAKDQAEQALASEIQYNNAKSDFLSRVSHELRTPLNAIIGMTDIARRFDERTDLEHCLEKIEDATEDLRNLVNNIIDMTGFDTGNFELFIRPFNFRIAVDSVIEDINSKALAKEQVFITDIDSGIYEWVESDEWRLKQILLNLLSNAVKFTPNNGKIEFYCHMTEDNEKECTIRFEIIDNGIGISQEMQEHLGEIFEQADNSITRAYSGLGLGLPLTKRIVDMMHGELWVDSELGKGSRFICNVRLGIVQFEPKGKNNRATEAAAGDPSSLDLTGKRIMIVDDVDLNRELLMMMLEDTGAAFDEASTGDEAVRLFLRDKYDMILMDLHMPVMNGFVATENIRTSTQPWAKTVPVISVSAESGSDLQAKSIKAGLTDHLPKPVELEALFAMIAKWI